MIPDNPEADFRAADQPRIRRGTRGGIERRNFPNASRRDGKRSFAPELQDASRLPWRLPALNSVPGSNLVPAGRIELPTKGLMSPLLYR